jgi:hypothetical protein
VQPSRTTDIQAADFGLSRASFDLSGKVKVSAPQALSLRSPAASALPKSVCPVTKFEYEVHTYICSQPPIRNGFHVLFVKSMPLARWQPLGRGQTTLRLAFSQNETSIFAGVVLVLEVPPV